jgi:hypothetical protein
MAEFVDVVLLHRPGDRPKREIIDAIEGQVGVQVRLHTHIGQPSPGDFNRWFTIARARNAMKNYGTAPWVMFVDDDVVLDRDCIYQLLLKLNHDPQLGAVGADYSNDRAHADREGHISLGATLWRRSVISRLQFRATNQLCECWCAAHDLRHNGIEIAYCDVAHARHLKPQRLNHAPPVAKPGLVLAAFDRRDIRRFQHHFLATLRASGNNEQVLAVGYGLYPSEANALSRMQNVRIEAARNNGQMVPVRRLHDFARLTEGLTADTPVAYWDVADVIFQDSLKPLWGLVAQNPKRLLAVAEPKGYPFNAVIPAWSLSIRDPASRARAFALLKSNPFLNSGFAAGSAAAMHAYFRRGEAMLNGPELLGTADWGDQMALNIYCHSEPSRWKSIDQRWNYCVHDRSAGEVFIAAGRVCSRRHPNLAVIHGNARSLRQFGLVTA